MGVLDQEEIDSRLEKNKNRFLSQDHTQERKEELKIDTSELYEPPPKILHSNIQTAKNKLDKLSASFAAVSREYELKKAQKKFKVPNIGKYDVKFKLVEERIKGINYNQTVQKTESKRNEVNKLVNSIPVWDRVVRALNAHHYDKFNSIISNNNEDIDYEDDKISENHIKIK